MKVLMISGDRHLLEEGSAAHTRFLLMRDAVERLDVFVWPAVHHSRAIGDAVKNTHYDVITAQDPFWRGLIAWRLARRTGARLNLQLHTVLAHESFIKRMLARFLFPHADSIRVVSEEAREALLKMHLRAHITVLPVYVDLAPYRNVQHHVLHKQHKVLLWAGRFEPEKNPGSLDVPPAGQMHAPVHIFIGAVVCAGRDRRAYHKAPMAAEQAPNKKRNLA